MTNKELEVKRAEELIFDYLPPLAKVFVTNSHKIDKKIEEIEQLVMGFMEEDGKVNGKMLSDLFNVEYPQIAEWFKIPPRDFYLKDEISIILDSLFKKEVNNNV